MKIALKAILWTKSTDKSGMCPIAIRITGGGKKTYYNTGIKIPAKCWNGDRVTKGADNYDIKNLRLASIIKDTEREILNRELQGQAITLELVKQIINPDLQVRGGNFLAYAKTIIAEKDEATKRRYSFEWDKMNAYANGKLNFGQITPAWLTKYYHHLVVKNSHNTAINAFKVIRHVFNRANKDKLTTLYPFDEWDYPQYKVPKKGYLQAAECNRIFDLLSKPEIDHDVKTVAAFFLLEVYGGLRISDWKKFSIEKITDARELIFTTTKTGTDVRLPLDSMPSLKKVVDYILTNDVRFTRDGKFANDNLKIIKVLAGLDMHLTTHVARHTFATMWLSKGMSKPSIAAMMGITVKQVDTYAKHDLTGIKDEINRIGGI